MTSMHKYYEWVIVLDFILDFVLNSYCIESLRIPSKLMSFREVYIVKAQRMDQKLIKSLFLVLFGL